MISPSPGCSDNESIGLIAAWYERQMMNLANKSLMQNFHGLYRISIKNP
jgi:hypothetical protein